MLITENIVSHVVPVVRFLQRLEANIPLELQYMTKDCLANREEQASSLCHNLKAFGSCRDRRLCLSRHFIGEKDCPNVIPRVGTVTGYVVDVCEASHYFMRLTEHTNLDGETNKNMNIQYMNLVFDMGQYYASPWNRKKQGVPNIDDICAVEGQDKAFYRVRVMGFTGRDLTGHVTAVEVHYLDEGHRKEVKIGKLFVLPEELQQIPPQAVEVFLCQIKPLDNDKSWTFQAQELVHTNIYRKQVVGKIVLSLGSTLWLNPFIHRIKLDAIHVPVTVCNVRQMLLEKQLAVENLNHLEALYQLCSGKLELPDYKQTVTSKRPTKNQHEVASTEPSYAFLPVSGVSDVYVSTVETLECFYVQRNDIINSLDTLEKDIEKWIRKENDQEGVRGDLGDGTLCLAMFPDDNRWYRARIESSSEVGDVCFVFFVDHGDRAEVQKERILPIPSYFIERLPFQAIECSLAHITTVDGSFWSSEMCNTFCAMTRNENDEQKLLFVKVLEKTNAGQSNRHRYIVELYETTADGSDIRISEKLVAAGIAKWTEIPDNMECVDKDSRKESDVNEMSDSEREVGVDLPPATSEDLSRDTESTLMVEKCEESLMEKCEEEEFDVQLPTEYVKCFTDSLVPNRQIVDRNASLEDEKDTDLLLENNNIKRNLPLSSLVNTHSPAQLQPTKVERDAEFLVNLPPLEVVEGVTETLTPHVKWSQTSDFVQLKILVPDVKDYELKLRENNIEFSTASGGKCYKLNINLFGHIIPEESTKDIKGQFFVVKLRKDLTAVSWPYLLERRIKVPWLSMDLDLLYSASSSDTEERLNLAKMQEKRKGTHQLAGKIYKSKDGKTMHEGEEIILSEAASSSEDESSDLSNDCPDTGIIFDPYNPLN